MEAAVEPSQAVLFETDPSPANKRHTHRSPNGKFRVHPGDIPSSAEVASVQRAQSIGGIFIGDLIYPNDSAIIRERARGQGVGYYDTMLKVDSDLAGFYRDLTDDVLHYPRRIVPASEAAAHQMHASFMRYAIWRIPTWQNVIRHAIDAYARGFSVFEKIYEVIPGGDWGGAVVYQKLIDKPQRWFTFDVERRLRFLSLTNQYPGELVDQKKFAVLVFGTNNSPWGEPTLDYVWFPWKLKHHGLKQQAIYMERWASPTALAEYAASRDKATNRLNQNKALDVLMSLQTDQAVAMPQGIAVKLLESLRNGVISFNDYIGALTEMESRLVTGQILTSMGAEGGSHALGKVHEKRAANKVEMLADWVSQCVNQLFVRELIDRNFGPQDVYPIFKILAKSPIARQAEATLEQQMIANGHELSRSYYNEVFDIVPPTDPGDRLTPPPNIKPGQVLPINTQLAETSPAPAERVELARHPELLADAKAKAGAKKARLEHIAKDAAKQARPAIRSIVKSLAGKVRAKGKRGLSHVRHAHLIGALKGAQGTHALGHALDSMLDRPDRLHYAEGDEQPPEISTSAKLALALLMLAIAQRIQAETADAAEGADAGQLADSLTDPAGAAVDEAFGNLFEGTHSTNIASIATAKLRRQLDDPRFRAANPYVMIVVTNANARLGHRVMDGYILSAEDARYSPFLPPFDFGCDCQAVPIPFAQARAMGLTGAQPVGNLQGFLEGKGLASSRSGSGYRTPGGEGVAPGPAGGGFAPAYTGTDQDVQLQALRQKAEDLRAQDPEAWAELHKWLFWLFAYDVLRQDPPPDEESGATAA